MKKGGESMRVKFIILILFFLSVDSFPNTAVLPELGVKI